MQLRIYCLDTLQKGKIPLQKRCLNEGVRHSINTLVLKKIGIAIKYEVVYQDCENLFLYHI